MVSLCFLTCTVNHKISFSVLLPLCSTWPGLLDGSFSSAWSSSSRTSSTASAADSKWSDGQHRRCGFHYPTSWGLYTRPVSVCEAAAGGWSSCKLYIEFLISKIVESLVSSVSLNVFSLLMYYVNNVQFILWTIQSMDVVVLISQPGSRLHLTTCWLNSSLTSQTGLEEFLRNSGSNQQFSAPWPFFFFFNKTQ